MREKIYEIVSIELGVPKRSITDETTIESIAKDSIDIIGLIALLSSELKIHVTPEKLKDIRTVGDIVEFAEQYAIKDNEDAGTLKGY